VRLVNLDSTDLVQAVARVVPEDDTVVPGVEGEEEGDLPTELELTDEESGQ
jgi:hypothetical protein